MKKPAAKFGIGQVVRINTPLFNKPSHARYRQRFQKIVHRFWMSGHNMWGYSTENNWMAVESWLAPLTVKEASK